MAALVIAALLMVLMGVSGMHGVAAVLGVAAVVCISSAVAGEMLQDLKVGHILGGTPAKMQIGDFMGVTVASFALLPVLLLLNQANINSGGTGFGDRQLSAPQAGLMAMLASGIVGGEMAWPLIIVGILMGIALIMIEVKSPMLFAVGMYLPLETTFAIFLGGMIRWVTDKIRDSKNFNDAQKARVENAGVLDGVGIHCWRGVDGHRHRRLQVQTVAAAPDFPASQRVCGVHRADHPSHRDDPGTAGQCRQPRRTGSANGDYVGKQLVTSN